MRPFKPYIALAPVSQALDGNSHALTLPQIARSGDVIRVVVSGTATAAIKYGTSSSATASAATDMLMLANSIELFELEPGTSHIAVNGASGSTVQITMGTGI